MFKPLNYLICVSLLALTPLGLTGGNCDRCGGNTEGFIYVVSEVCQLLDLQVDQSPYGGAPVFIETDELRGLSADGTVVADLLITSNVFYSITLADVFLQNNDAPSGEDVIALYPLIKEEKAGINRFEEPDRIFADSVNREFVWDNFRPNQGYEATSPVVMLYVDAMEDGNPRAPDGIINPYPGEWEGTIRVILTPF